MKAARRYRERSQAASREDPLIRKHDVAGKLIGWGEREGRIVQRATRADQPDHQLAGDSRLIAGEHLASTDDRNADILPPAVTECIDQDLVILMIIKKQIVDLAEIRSSTQLQRERFATQFVPAAEGSREPRLPQAQGRGPDDAIPSVTPAPQYDPNRRASIPLER